MISIFHCINSCMTVGVTILGFGLRQFLSIEYFHQDTSGQKKLINQIIMVYVCIAIPVSIILLSLQSSIMHWLCLHHLSPHLFTITVITMFLYFFAELFYQVLKYQQRAWLITSIQTIIAFCSLALTITLLIYFDYGIMSSLIGQLASMCAATAIGIYLYHQEGFSKSWQFKPHSKTIIHFLKQGFPFMPGNFI